LIVENRAYSYVPKDSGGYKKSVLSYANVGATSLFTTVEDLARWVKNFNDARVGGSHVLEQMHQQGKLNDDKTIDYAFALRIKEYRGLKVVEHTGWDAGFRSVVMRFPDHDFAVIVLTNLMFISPGYMARQVAEIYMEDQMKPGDVQQGFDKAETVKMDPSVFDRYTGNYELKDGSLISILREADRMILQLTGYSHVQRFHLLPASETKLLHRDLDIRVSFNQEKGKQIALNVTHPWFGENIPGERINYRLPSSQPLEEFTGNFYSEELGTFYTLAIENSSLVAQHRRHSDIPLTPKGEDAFLGGVWFLSNLKFQRNDNGEISGFLLTGDRARDLKFYKRNP